MSADALEDKLGDMFRVLVGSDRRALQRQQTLVAVVDWSHDLLTEDERTVLRRLSVFMGSFSVNAAEQVSSDGTLAADQVADVLFHLVDRSLVEREADGDRYRLLETIRQYAEAKLKDANESAPVRGRHLEAFLAMAERLGPTLDGLWNLDLLLSCQPDTDNLYAAIEWALRSGRIDDGLRFTASTPWFFIFQGRDELALFEEAIAAAGDEDTLLLARAHLGIAIAGEAHGNPPWAGDAFSRALAMFERLGTDDADPSYGWAVTLAAVPNGYMGDASAALEALDRAEAFVSRDGWTAMLSVVWAWRGWALRRSGDLVAGRQAMAHALDLARGIGNELWVGECLFKSGIMSSHARDFTAARGFYGEVLPIFRRLTFKMWLQWALDHVSSVALTQGDLPAARAYAEEAITASREGGLAIPQGNYPFLLATLGRIEHRLGNLDEARWYYEQGVELLQQAIGMDPLATSHGWHHAHVVTLARLGLVELDAGAIGSATSALREALDILATLEPVELSNGSVQQAPIDAVLLPVAWLAAQRGDMELAAALAGAVTSWQERASRPFGEAERAEYEERIAPVRDAAGTRFNHLFEAGRMLGNADAIARAIASVQEAVTEPA